MTERFCKIGLQVGVIISLLLLIILPDIYLLHAHPDLGIWWMGSSVLLACLLVSIVYCVPWLWLQILLITILLLISMTEVLSVYTYYNFMNAISFPAFKYANSSEMDDMSFYIVHYAFKHEVLPLLLYCISIVLLILKSKRQIKSKYDNSIIFLCIVAIFLSCLIGDRRVFSHSPYHIFKEAAAATQFEKNRELHLPLRYDFTYGAEQQDSLDNNIVVFGIGESVNYAHCSFNNQYHRHTTPQLEKERNSIFYTNYFSTALYTEQALPLLLTRATPGNFNLNYEEKPILTAFKEARYKTFVISHKSQIMNNGVDGYLAEGADSVFFVETDAEIVDKLKKIASKVGNVFVLLHFSGSHFFYNNYPHACNKWRPNYNHDKKAISDSLFINAYDNSILYADWLLNECIECLKEPQRVASFIFISDHGEYLDEHVGGHGLSCVPTKEEYHVPFMIWYSEEYAEAYPGRVANSLRHKDEPVCADHVFWSVLDMANIRIDSILYQDGLSVFGNELLPHERSLVLPNIKSTIILE